MPTQASQTARTTVFAWNSFGELVLWLVSAGQYGSPEGSITCVAPSEGAGRGASRQARSLFLDASTFNQGVYECVAD